MAQLYGHEVATIRTELQKRHSDNIGHIKDRNDQLLSLKAELGKREEGVAQLAMMMRNRPRTPPPPPPPLQDPGPILINLPPPPILDARIDQGRYRETRYNDPIIIKGKTPPPSDVIEIRNKDGEKYEKVAKEYYEQYYKTYQREQDRITKDHEMEMKMAAEEREKMMKLTQAQQKDKSLARDAFTKQITDQMEKQRAMDEQVMTHFTERLNNIRQFVDARDTSRRERDDREELEERKRRDARQRLGTEIMQPPAPIMIGFDEKERSPQSQSTDIQALTVVPPLGGGGEMVAPAWMAPPMPPQTNNGNDQSLHNYGRLHPSQLPPQPAATFTGSKYDYIRNLKQSYVGRCGSNPVIMEQFSVLEAEAREQERMALSREAEERRLAADESVKALQRDLQAQKRSLEQEILMMGNASIQMGQQQAEQFRELDLHYEIHRKGPRSRGPGDPSNELDPLIDVRRLLETRLRQVLKMMTELDMAQQETTMKEWSAIHLRRGNNLPAPRPMPVNEGDVGGSGGLPVGGGSRIAGQFTSYLSGSSKDGAGITILFYDFVLGLPEDVEGVRLVATLVQHKKDKPVRVAQPDHLPTRSVDLVTEEGPGGREIRGSYVRVKQEIANYDKLDDTVEVLIEGMTLEENDQLRSVFWSKFVIHQGGKKVSPGKYKTFLKKIPAKEDKSLEALDNAPIYGEAMLFLRLVSFTEVEFETKQVPDFANHHSYRLK